MCPQNIKMYVIIIAALLISSVLGSPAGGRPEGRIIGGRDAFAGEYPFAAAITTQTATGQYFFGGALVNNLWIITSGSAVDGATLFTIRLGIERLDSTDGERLATDTYVLNPDYNPLTLEGDIGLIKLRERITFTDYIRAINFPLRDVQPFAVVETVGWGQVNDQDAGLFNSLQTVTLTVLSNDECRITYGNAITDNMVCVDGNYNEGTCYGDTGSPLIQNVNLNQQTIVGVASFISGNGCESPDPSGFTRTLPYLGWILDTAQQT